MSKVYDVVMRIKQVATRGFGKELLTRGPSRNFLSVMGFILKCHVTAMFRTAALASPNQAPLSNRLAAASTSLNDHARPARDLWGDLDCSRGRRRRLCAQVET